MKIAVFYHCLLKADGLDDNHLYDLVANQAAALIDSGLADAASEIIVNVNGDDDDAAAIGCIMPDKAKIHFDKRSRTELPTIYLVHDWAKKNPGCAVLYHHTKGAKYPGNPTWIAWRNCMERACVWGWKRCLVDIMAGADTVGAHWMTNGKYQMVGRDQRYWGGNFWWASSDYLATLPTPADDCEINRYEAETWVGKSKKDPKIVDYAPHFPTTCKP